MRIKIKNNIKSGLHILYNKADSSNFSSEDFNKELQLYLDAKQESGLDSFSYKNLPVDHSLIKILESKRERYLHQWESKLIPIGSSHKSDEDIIADFKNLSRFNTDSILRKDTLGNSNILWHYSHLASGLNQYFPEMLDTPTINPTVIDGLRDSNRFLKIYIEKVLLNGFGRYEGNFFSAFNRCFRSGNFTQAVGNFQPLFMKYIILEAFKQTLKLNGGLPNDKFVIIDPCAGWSGRLLGTLCSMHDMRKIYKGKTGKQLTICYITTDPNTQVHGRFLNIAEDWFDFVEPKDTKDYFKFSKDTVGCETPEFIEFCKSKFAELGVTGANLAMTSPPYWNREKYSKDPAQSFLKYPKYQGWKEGFLKGMIQNVFDLLLDGGRFYLNVADISKSGKITPIATDAMELSRTCGFNCLKTYKMIMGSGKVNSENKVNVNGISYKYEPVYVLQK